MKLPLCLVMLVSALVGQDLAGDWQGTLGSGAGALRVVVRIDKQSGAWHGVSYTIDQSPSPVPIDSITLDGFDLKMEVGILRGRYEGRLAADGNTIAGTWIQGSRLPLDFKRATKDTAWTIDPARHTIQYVTVDTGVRLEVLDYGGAGRALVLLTGLGDNAHTFDAFAPKLVAKYHVYGITRRGFGASSIPATGYTADRLGDDVLAVIDSLKIQKPILAGHSIAGEELSSIGARYPEKIAGLIYLDAGYPYAFYDASHPDLIVDLADMRKKLENLESEIMSGDPKAIGEVLGSLPAFEKDLRDLKKSMEDSPRPANQPAPYVPPAAAAILAGVQKYREIRVPILAIYALPHSLGPQFKGDDAARAEAEKRDMESTGAQAKAFESGLPSARVVRIARADHYVFKSNEEEVLREMNAFIARLP